MPVSLSLPTVLARLADGQRTLDAPAGTVRDVLTDVSRRFPTLAPRLLDEKGEAYPFVTFYLNDEDIRFAGGLAASVHDGDELTVVSAVAGG